MKIAAYQFAVTPDIRENRRTIEKAVMEAEGRQIDLADFPECALTGYPPRDIPSSARVDFTLAEECCDRLQAVCNGTGVAFVTGTIAREAGRKECTDALVYGAPAPEK